MILSDRDIKRRLGIYPSGAKRTPDGSESVFTKTLTIEPLDPSLIQPASIDIRLGKQLKRFKEPSDHNRYVIDPFKSVAEHMCEEEIIGTYFLLPGQFILGQTLEYFEFPNDLAGRIEGKSSLGRLGLLVHVTAGYIDPGFKGYLTLEIYNLAPSPIPLTAGMRIGQISFSKMSTPVENPYNGRYQNQMGVEASKYHEG